MVEKVVKQVMPTIVFVLVAAASGGGRAGGVGQLPLLLLLMASPLMFVSLLVTPLMC